uniref:Uncharacterized protein n=2 Tax=environmental samples TaxID=651140 RepID=A0A075FQA1_9ARCH|nr:hypothetical protein [uncultured marine thaumarchaeote AD1000_36_B08]AIF23076.1 hypothetical protein [uncultured marine thaumarchaeote SAT1000_12_G09]
MVNESIPGKSGTNHKIPVAVKVMECTFQLHLTKQLEIQLTKNVLKFYEIADDVKNGIHGTQLTDAIYGSSVGFKGDALVELERLSKSRKQNPEDKLEFKTANFENRIYSVTKC